MPVVSPGCPCMSAFLRFRPRGITQICPSQPEDTRPSEPQPLVFAATPVARGEAEVPCLNELDDAPSENSVRVDQPGQHTVQEALTQAAGVFPSRDNPRFVG